MLSLPPGRDDPVRWLLHVVPGSVGEVARGFLVHGTDPELIARATGFEAKLRALAPPGADADRVALRLLVEMAWSRGRGAASPKDWEPIEAVVDRVNARWVPTFDRWWMRRYAQRFERR